jgi:outer membrane receptor protein involved in Fe transport
MRPTTRLVLCSLIVLAVTSHARAQDTGSVSGVVVDSSGQVIPGATVTLTDERPCESRTLFSRRSQGGAMRLVQRAACAFMIALVSAPAAAQVLYGSLVVDVRDQSGLPLPGAQVTITQTGTNWTREATTNNLGAASFSTVPTGAYVVRVALQSFSESVTTGVQVTVGNVTRLKTVLKVGALTDTVTVTADRPVLQTDRADVRTEIGSTQLENLPVPLGRNYQNLFVLVPGISPPENMHSVAVNPARGLGFTSNGTTRNSNSIRIEGAITNNLWLPHVAAYVPGLDAIETVSVTTGSFDADLGLSGGMSANVQIKSGTNDLRGSAFGYHYNEALKSRPFFLPASEPKQDARHNQIGGTLGGRIVRDRLFFFGSYEGTHDRLGANRFGTVPTEAMRRGDLSAAPNPIYDPLTGNADGSGKTPFRGNIIPRDRLDPIVQKLLAGLPMPTFADRLTNNYLAKAEFTLTRHKTDAKVNFNATDTLFFSGRLGWLNYNFDSPPMFGDLGGRPVHDPSFKMGSGLGDTYTITGTASYVVKQNLLFDSYAGITLIKINSEPPRMDEQLGLEFLGIPGTNGPNRLYGGWPQFNVTNYSEIGYVGSRGTPYIDDNWQYQYTANVSWAKGSHTIRFGGDIVRQALNRFEVGSPSGTFTFAGGPTTIRGGPSSNQFNTIATFLLGLPTTISKDFVPFEDNRMRTRNWQFSTFVKDEWQVRRNVTASLGLRWDYFPMGTRTTRGLERYDFDANQMLICGVGSVPEDCGYDMGAGNFSPRLGLAYRATDRLVIRAGYGLNYDPYPLAFVRDLIGNYPSNINLSVPSPNAFRFAGRLRDGIPAITAPDISAGVIPIPLNVSARALDQKPKRGYIHSWNVTLQRELPWGFTGQAGYVATRQREINQILDQNAGQVVGAGNAGRPLFQRFRRTAHSGLLTNVGWNDYDSLQTSLQRRFSQGLQANVAYTWSRSYGLCCDVLSDNPPRIQARDFFDLNRARMPHDRPHNFQASVVAELPFGPGKPFLNNGGLLAQVLGGWQVNGLSSLYSGAPFTVTASGTSLNLPGSNQVADQVKPEVAILGGIGRDNPYFDPLAFRGVTEPRFGTAGFNSLRGPSFRNFDFSVFRQFNLANGANLQFRAEVFNLTNTPHFGNPSANASNLQLNPDGTIRNLGGFGTITSTANSGRDGIDERLVRLGLRIAF